MPGRVDGPGVPAPAPSRPDLPPSVDVSRLDPASAEFRALPPAYQRAVREAQTFARTEFSRMAPPPRVLVVPSAANGGQPVTVVVPPGAATPARVHTHYHGDAASAVGMHNPAAKELAAQVRNGSDTVYVLPEAARPATTGTDWTNVRSMGQTTADALRAAGLDGDVAHRTLSVHSAGGRALAKALERGEQLQADLLLVQDAQFEGLHGPGAHSAMKRDLPGATAGVASIAIVPSAGVDHRARTRALEDALRAAGRDVTVTPPARTHDDAARVLTAPALALSLFPDRFVR